MSGTLSGFSVGRLRILLITLYSLLLIPSALLFWQALQQIEWDVFLTYQEKARTNLKTIDEPLQQWIERENRRSAEDYQFARAIRGSNAPVIYVPGPLSTFPNADIPGLMGYFEVDAQGNLSTPLLPLESEPESIQTLPLPDRVARENVRLTLVEVLTRNPIPGDPDALPRPSAPAVKARVAKPTEESASEAHLGLSIEHAPDSRIALSDLALERSQYALNQKKERARGIADFAGKMTSEPEAIPEQTAAAPAASVADLSEEHASGNVTVPLPPSQNDALRLIRLNEGHLLLYRTQWHNGERKVQGMLIDANAFMKDWLVRPYRQSELSTSGQQVIAYRGAILSIEQAVSGVRGYASSGLDTAEKARQTTGILIHQGSLSPPFQDFEIAYSVSSLPSGPGTLLIQWSGGLLILLLSVGFWLLMRVGKRQLALIHQQRDFVAAVSHELKTPLTSIRMYSELLDQGWVNDDKKKTYYTFILRESERLSRLINNVLLFSKMGRKQAMELTPMPLERVQSIIQSVAEPLTEAAGFVLRFDNPEGADKLEVAINPDGLQQITVNLIDNAIKFSAQCEMKTIEVSFRQHRNELVIGFRDYGPGIPHDQAKKIFDLFYRGERELTRKTTGTGIGLALVRALVESMGAQIEAVPLGDGLEMRLTFAVRHG
ncbi:MAG: HAMP domain-containing histidine kinase [Hahellaceae bacterium]|nr:HAMP domain-containing histidine kinase [Hahellaceae bacterium]